MNSLIISLSRHATFTNFLSRSRRVIVQKKSRFEIIDIPSLESREKSASFKGRSWISLEGKKKMAARIFGKRNILVNNQSDRDRFLDFVLEFPGSKRGKGEREREERVFAASTRVHEAVNGRCVRWQVEARREESTRHGALHCCTRGRKLRFRRQREKRRKKEEEERKDRLPGARSSFRAN